MEWMILPLKRYAQFSGRSARREFWMWILFYVLCIIVLSIADAVLHLGGATNYGRTSQMAPGAVGYSYGAGVRGGVLTLIFSVATFIPNLAVAVRRLHDTNRSGWWILLPLVPYAIGVTLTIGVTFAGPAAGLGAGRSMGMIALGGIAMLISLICAIVLLVWYCSRGTAGTNRFGPDPYAGFGDLEDTFR